jgi:cytochrome c oxidase subunit 1
MLSIAPSDYQYHDTYFVVGHFHYVIVPGAVFGAIAAVYYWMPKFTGRMYSQTLAKFHFWLSAISLNITFFPMHFLGLAGMPRRIPDYALQFTEFNHIASAGAFMFGFSQVLFLYIILKSMRSGKKIHAKKVWEGAHGLEWTLPTPLPYHTFETPPNLKDKPLVYTY